MKNILLVDEYLQKARKVKAASKGAVFNTKRSTTNYQNNFYYSSTPKEVVFKVIRDYKKGPISGYAVKRALLYIANEKDEENIKETFEEFELDKDKILETYNLYTHDGRVLKTKKEIDEIFNEWKKTFSSNERKNGKDAEHILLSTSEPTDEATDKMIIEASKKTLETYFLEKGYEYMFNLHKDITHTHAHGIIRTYNPKTKKQLRILKQDIKDIKTSFANNLQEQGLNYVVSININRIKDMSERLEIVESKNNSWFRENIEKLKSDDIDELGKNLLSTQEKIKELNSQKTQIQEKIKDIFYDKNKEDEKIKLKAELKVIDKKNSKLYANFKAYLKLLNEYETSVQDANKNYNIQKENLSKISGFFITQSLSYKKLEKQTEQARQILLQSRISLDKAHFYLNQINLDKKYSINLDKQKEINYTFQNIQDIIKSNDKELIANKLIYNINKLQKEIQEYSHFSTYIDKKVFSELLKIKENVIKKTQTIQKTILPIKEYLEKNKDELSEDKYNKFTSKIEKIENNLNADIPSLSVNDAKFLGINTDELAKFSQDINYKKDVISENLSIAEVKKSFTMENIDLLNINLKDIEFKEDGISEYLNKSKKALAISKDIDNLIQAIDIELTDNNISSTHCYKQQEKLLNIKKRLEGDFPSLSIKDAQFLGINTLNLPKLEKFELKKEDGSIFVIENIDLEKLDLEKLSKNIDIDYKQEIINLKNLNIEDFKDDKYFDKYSTASQKAIENKDLNSFDELQNLYKVDSSITVKAYGEILNISPREVNISLWEKLGENRESYDLESLKLIIEVQNKDYQKEFVNIYIDKLKTEYALQKEMPENEHEFESYFKSLNNFEKLCEEFKTEFNENKEKLENFNNIKHLLDTGQFLSANKLLNSLDEFDRLALKSYYEKAIDIHSQNFDDMDDIKNKIEFEAELRDKEYIIASELGEELPISNAKKIDVETVKFEHPFEKVEVDFNVEDKKDIEVVPGEVIDFNKAITIERNAEFFRQKINEKEKLTQDEKMLQKLEEIKRYINKANPNLSINDAKFLGVDTNNFEKYTKEISYKVFDFSSSQEIKKEFEEFANNFPKFSKDILDEAINKQEISFEKLELIGIKPTQFKNISKDDFANKKIDLKNNIELLNEFNKLAKDFPELAKNELTKSFEKGNITTGRLAKYGMIPERFKNFKDTQISDKTDKIDFIDFKKNNIYKKDFIIKIDYKNKKINQNLNIQSLKNSIKKENTKNINFEEINKILKIREDKISNQINSYSLTNKEKATQAAKQICYALYGNLQHIKDTQAHVNNLTKHDDKLLNILNSNLIEHKKVARDLNKQINEFISNINKSKFTKEEKIEINNTIFESLEKINYSSNILENTNSKIIKESIKNRDIEEYRNLSLDLYYVANSGRKVNTQLDKADILLKRIKAQELSLTDKLKIKAIQNHIEKSKNLHIKNARQKEK